MKILCRIRHKWSPWHQVRYQVTDDQALSLEKVERRCTRRGCIAHEVAHRCDVDMHRWGRWSEPVEESTLFLLYTQSRVCPDCGRVQMRKVKV